MSNKKDAIKQAMVAINKKFGAGTVGTLTEKMSEFEIKYIPTRSAAFNSMLYGGFGVGKIVEIFGQQDSGKTSICLDTIGYNMQKDPEFTAGWFETEGHFDVDYAVNFFGIDPDRFTVWSIEDFGAERGLDVLESLLRTGAYNMIVVNTVAGLTPKSELESNMEDRSVAEQARMMSKLMRKVTAVASKKKTTMIFVNQVRTNVGAYMGGDVPAGGKALAFWASQRIYMRSGFIDAEDKKRGYDGDNFKKIDALVKKNRLSALQNPYQKCTYFVEYGKGIDTIGELPLICVEMGILQKAGAFFKDIDNKGNIKVFNGHKLQFQGVGALRGFLQANPDYAEELQNRIAAITGNRIEQKAQLMTDEEIEEAKKEQAELESGLEGTDEE